MSAMTNADMDDSTNDVDKLPDGQACELEDTKPRVVGVKPVVSQEVTASKPGSPAGDVAGMAGIEKPPAKANSRGWRFKWLVLLFGLLALGAVAVVSAAGGYLSGIGLRRAAAVTQVAGVAQEQYDMALQDIQQGDFYTARQRLEYVISLQPNFPSAVGKLSEVLLALNTTATPTLVPTPTLTPTPDLRSVLELFDQAGQFLANNEWDKAITALLTLRQDDPTFRTVDVDDMLFMALRNRGREKITKADLEGGIYDLTIAKKFGPLDTEVEGLLTWATLYITGASFWGLDWAQVVSYFSQVAPNYPSLMDKSGMTAAERYRLGLFEYGNWLAATGKACKAIEQYRLSLSLGYDAKVEQAGIAASKACEGAKPKPTETPVGQP
jgi:tetratricopeptide (TPR) repeat protein